MGINNVLAAHSVGAGAGQSPADYTNSQSGQQNGSLASVQPQTSTQAQQPLPDVAMTQAQIARLTLYGVLLADALLLYIALKLVG